jgi:hypothetical protein
MKKRKLSYWLKLGYHGLEIIAIATPIIWVPIYLYQKRFDSAYLCSVLVISIIICSLVERRAEKWQKVAECWEKEAKQWQLFDAKVNALEEGQTLTIKKGGDKAKNYRVM